jgi:hypothetical protein
MEASSNNIDLTFRIEYTLYTILRALKSDSASFYSSAWKPVYKANIETQESRW